MWLPDQAPELKRMPVWTLEQFRSLSEILANIGRRNPYTPLWTAETTQPSLGNGSLVGSYVEIGQWMAVQIRLIAGSTTTFGTGRQLFSIPRGVNAGVGVWQGVVRALDSSTVLNYIGVTHLAPGIFTDRFFTIFDTTGFLDVGIPFAWASGDTLDLDIGFPLE